jgi:hypothetical protein
VATIRAKRNTTETPTRCRCRIAVFVDSGPFASDGIYGNLLLAAFLLWVLLSSVILVRGVDAE